ncbi:MAG: hypothetical protein AAF721_16690 [Myxococcota bacterium]
MSINEFEFHNLAFLASMSAVTLGCPSADDRSSSPTGGPALTGMTSPMNDGGDATGADGNDDGGNADNADNADDGGNADNADDGGNADNADGATMDGNPMDDAGTDDGVDGGGSSGGATASLCESYAELLGGCYEYQPMEIEALAVYCETLLVEGAAANPACPVAIEEWLACVNQQSCRMLFEPCDNIDLSACPEPEGSTGGS